MREREGEKGKNREQEIKVHAMWVRQRVGKHEDDQEDEEENVDDEAHKKPEDDKEDEKEGMRVYAARA